MFGTAVLGVVVALACSAVALPDYGTPSLSSSYGSPPVQACYPKYVTKTLTKNVQVSENHYDTVTKQVPTTQYAYITETLVYPTTIKHYSTMTAYAQPIIHTKTTVLYDTKLVRIPVYKTVSKYRHNTAQQYITETTGVDVTTIQTQSYPLTNTVTETGYKTNAYYVTKTQVTHRQVTMTVKKPYYQTQYETQYKQEYDYHTVTQTVNRFATQTVYHTVPEYHTVSTQCYTTRSYGY